MSNNTFTTKGAEQLLDCVNCGSQFKRSTDYLTQNRSDPLYKWKCIKCDTCVDKRVNQAFKSMPKKLSALAEG